MLYNQNSPQPFDLKTGSFEPVEVILTLKYDGAGGSDQLGGTAHCRNDGLAIPTWPL
jgi:hypothetical protein